MSKSIGATDVVNLEVDRSVTSAGAVGFGKIKKTPQLTSVAWTHFDKFITYEGKNKAKCKHCLQIYHADSRRNGISNSLSHIKKCVGNPENICDMKVSQKNCKYFEIEWCLTLTFDEEDGNMKFHVKE